ncbi:MAG: alpha/beta hydrolase [Cyanobacteria bacterium SZAS-4]|nr:alpha/beta hydrolase [Cyanobacteria bacterium SZAS-4]
MTAVVVFIPGIMGSQLTSPAGKIVWPGEFLELIAPYKHMDALLDEQTAPTDIIRDYGIIPQYSLLVKDLNSCGFSETSNPPTLICFAYDWRKSNVLAAKALSAKLDSLLEQNPAIDEIILIGHSMGGLICRYYLESGKFNDAIAFAKVAKLITLATPHRGSPLALTAILGQDRKMWLRPDQVASFAADARYPAVYELMPPNTEPFLWDETPAANLSIIDLVSKTAEMKLSAENLAQAAAFHKGLDLSKKPDAVRYFCFVGSRMKTATTALYAKDPKAFHVRKFESEGGGDGTVPFASGLLPSVQWFAVGGEHGQIYKDKDLRHRLGILLGKPGLLPGETKPSIVTKEYVIGKNDPIQAVIKWTVSINSIDGNVILEKATDVTDQKVEKYVEYSKTKVEYTGPSLEHLSIELPGPKYAGVYKIRYSSTDGTETCDYQFFVQG